jgi:hypothetical protein
VSLLRSAHRAVFGTPEQTAGTVYGTIVVMGTLTAGSAAKPTAWELAVVTSATVTVLWIAHVYAHSLGRSLAEGIPLTGAMLRNVGRHESAIALSAVVPVAVLLLAAVHVLAASTAVWCALAVGVATLAVEGARYARIEGFGRPGMAASVGVNIALGLVIVALKALVVH